MKQAIRTIITLAAISAGAPLAYAQSAPAVEAKPAKQAKPAPRDIPMIETHNDESSHAGVTYVTGGIGDDEREAIEAAKEDYNLHVTSASNDGAFVGDARVVIVNKAGEEMLNVVAGPLLYVRLPAGNYVLDASLGEQKKHQSFTVAKKGQPVMIRMGWKVASGS